MSRNKFTRIFKLFFLLKNDSIKSPIKANKMMNAIYKVNSTSIGIFKIKAINNVNKNEIKNPPIKPSTVLLGLILVNFNFPIVFPIK